MEQSNPAFSLIIPTLDERDNIIALISGVEAALKDIPFEIIVIDDESSDGTPEAVEQYALAHPYVHCVRRTEKNGLSAAVIEGFNRARGPFLGVMDADLSHDPAILPELVRAVRGGGAEAAVGSRRVKGGGADKWPWFRRAYSNFATLLAKEWLNVPVNDPMSGYFVIGRGIFDKVRRELNPKGYKILLEILTRAQVSRVAEVPFVFKDRKQGYSKLTGKVAYKYLEMLWDLRAYAPFISRLRYNYHTGRYKKVASMLREGRTLDIGCGRPCESMPDQSFLIFLGRQDSAGLDLKELSGPYEFHRASADKMPFPDASFDNVTAMEVLEHLDNFDATLSEIRRVLRPGGVFVASTPEGTFLWDALWWVWSSTIGRMWKHEHLVSYGIPGWKRILETRFNVAEVRRHWHFDLIFRCTIK